MKTPRSIGVRLDADRHAPRPTTAPSGSARRPVKQLRRVLPLLAVCASIVWSLTRLLTVDDDPAIRRSPRPTALASRDVPADTVVPGAATQGDTGLGDLPGTELRRFLATKVERLVDDTAIIEPIRASAIPPRKVSLVNLWATWCEPCKSELPRLRSFFAEHRLGLDWGPAIQFVAVMVDDGMTAHAASRGFKATMPTDTVFLVDRNLDGGVKEALRAVGMYPSQLPVTMLLDCNRRVRWHRVGALEEVDLPAIGIHIEALRKEDACRKPRPADGSVALAEAVPPLLPAEDAAAPEPDAADTEADRSPAPDAAPALPAPEVTPLAAPPGVAVKESSPTPSPVATRCDVNHVGTCGDGCHNRGEDCERCPEDVQCGEHEECLPRGDQAPTCVITGSIAEDL